MRPVIGLLSQADARVECHLICPTCGYPLTRAKVKPGVVSRLHLCTRDQQVFLHYGDYLYQCTNAAAMLVPGQM